MVNLRQTIADMSQFPGLTIDGYNLTADNQKKTERFRSESITIPGR
jgi:hypothetical protein